MEKPDTVPIAGVRDEAADVKTVFLQKRMQAKPGQFVMAWIPGMDEKPFAISYLDQDRFGITVAAVGPFSRTITSMKPGNKVGIRGPYGTGYALLGKKIALVGGGYGAASLALLAEEAVQKGIEVIFINGARSRERLVFEKRIADMGARLMVVTDDGSAGMRGRTTDALEEVLEKGRIDKVFACGPEMMLKKVAAMCAERKVACEVSIERYMKCGFGVCGHCCLDPTGIRACVEGPVIDGRAALQLTEFGSYRRTKSGKKEQFHV